MKRIWVQAGKESKQFLRDRLTLAVAATLPLALMALYGSAMKFGISNVPLFVEDLDNTPLSRSYVDAYAATRQFVVVRQRDQAKAALLIPAGFERDWLRGGRPQVQMVIDGTESNTAILLRNIGSAVAQTFRPPLRPAVVLKVRYWYNPGLSDALFFGSGALGLVLILFPALLGAIAVSRELELGTVAQAYASTMTAPEWLIGKAIPYLVTGVVQLVFCFGMGVVVFAYRVPDHVLPLAAASLLYITAAVFFGMMAGNLAGTQSAAIQAVQLGAFLLSMLLSGFLMPLSNAPVLLQYVSMLVPARHYIEATREVMLRGGGWEAAWRPVAMLAALGLLFFSVNLGLMRRMQYKG